MSFAAVVIEAGMVSKLIPWYTSFHQENSDDRSDMGMCMS